MRDEALIDLRPKIELEIHGKKNDLEHFMHATLRPILKFQHQIILSLIENSSHFKKLNLSSFPEEERREKLKQFVSKNSALKNQLVGLTVGIFTTEEVNFYILNSSEINKRIVDMCVTRFDSSSLH